MTTNNNDLLARVQFALEMYFEDSITDVGVTEEGLDALLTSPTTGEALRITVAVRGDGETLEAHYHLPNDTYVVSNYDCHLDAIIAQTKRAFSMVYGDEERPVVIEGIDVVTALLDGSPFIRIRACALNDEERYNEQPFTVWALDPFEGHEIGLLGQVESPEFASVMVQFYAAQRQAGCPCGSEHRLSFAIPEVLAAVE